MKKNLIKVLTLFFSISIFAEGAGTSISEEEQKTIDSILESWHESYELLSNAAVPDGLIVDDREFSMKIRFIPDVNTAVFK